MIQYLEQENIPDFPDVEIFFIEDLMIFYFSKILVIILFRIKEKSLFNPLAAEYLGIYNVGFCHSLLLSIISFETHLYHARPGCQRERLVRLDRPESGIIGVLA